MSMHEYAVFGHDRALVGRWLGVISVSVVGGVVPLLVSATQLTGWSAFSQITITTSAVYFFLHWLFNKWVWKIPFLEVPNLSGTWRAIGQTLNDDGTTRYAWEAEIKISQTWKEILIHLHSKNSQSLSYTATISRRRGPTGGWLLSYSYRNEPEVEQLHELSAHRGYCEIEFNEQLAAGKASYFNSAGRRTFGVMRLKKGI